MKRDPYAVDAPEEGESRGNQYMSKRDVRIIAAILAVLGIALYPIYQYGKEISLSSQCVNNMRAMHTALATYTESHDSGLPPLYRASDDGTPFLIDGRAYTWISDVAPGMSTRNSFRCPASEDAEVAHSENPTSSTALLASAYGMYMPYGATKTYNIDSPETTALIGETANKGAMNSFDPHPLPGDDGFVIGFDSGNGPIRPKTIKAVTRLAFRDTKTGVFKADSEGRHPKGSHYLTASGQLVTLKAGSSVVQLGPDGYPVDFWRVPPQRAR